MAYSLLNRRISQNKIFDERKKILALATGGDIFISGSYRYHVFKSTAAFSVLWKSSDAKFDYAIIGGSAAGSAGSSTNGGSGGDSYYRIGYDHNLDDFNLGTSYTVTVGGAGSASTLSTKSTTLSSAGAGSGFGGAGGYGYNVSPNCTGTVSYETNCCCYDSNNDGIDCCEAFCDPEEGCCGACVSVQYCGQTEICSTNCVQCQGNEASQGGSGGGGLLDFDLTQFGPQGSLYTYGQGGGGGGGASGNGASGGYPNGGRGGFPVGSGTSAPANTGVGGGGGGGAWNGGGVCVDTGVCTAEMQGGSSSDGSPGSGGAGTSGIVFIRYKFQE